MGAIARLRHFSSMVVIILSLMAGIATPATHAMDSPRPTKVASTWPYIGYDQARTNYNPVEQGFSTKNIAKLTQIWPATPRSDTIVSNNGIVYTIGDTSYLLSRLTSIDLKTAKVLWHGKAPAGMYSPYRVQFDGATDLLAPFASTNQKDSFLVKFATPEDKVVWSYPVTNGWVSDPVMIGGLDYFFSGPNKGLTSTLVAVDDTTGKLKWQTNAALLNGPLSLPATDGTHLFVTTSKPVKGERTIQTYALADGKLLWTRRFTGTAFIDCLAPMVAVKQHLVYESCSNGLYALDTATGAITWHVLETIAIGDWSNVATNGDVVLQIYGGNVVFTNYYLVAVDARTGAVRWKEKHATNDGSTFRSVVIAGDVFFVAASRIPGNTQEDSGIIGYSLATGKRLWDGPLAENVTLGFGEAPLIITDGKLLLATPAGVFAYSVR